MRKVLIGIAATLGLAAVSQADLINVSNYTQYQAAGGKNGVALTSSGKLGLKSEGGITGFGGAKGIVKNEIDGNEWVQFDFVGGKEVVDYFTLGCLYAKGQFGDNPSEVAVVWDFVNGQKAQYTLTVADNGLSATWAPSQPGSSVTTLSPGLQWPSPALIAQYGIVGDRNGGGVFKVANPFGNLAVSSVKFVTPQNAINASGPDYTIVNFASSKSVPEPATMSFLAAGLMSLVGLAMRRKRS